MPMPYLDNHGHTVSTWLLRLANHPSLKKRLLEDAQVFSMFFAALKPRVTWTQEFEDMLKSRLGHVNEVTFDTKAFDAWKQSADNPFAGKITSVFLENIFEGLTLYGKIKRQSAVWDTAIETLYAQVPQADTKGKPMAPEPAPALRDARAKLPTPGDSLFHANLAILNWMVPFSTEEKAVLELGFLLSHDESVRFFFDTAHASGISWRSMLRIMLDVNEDLIDTITSSSGTLMKSGLLSIDAASRRVFPLSDFWHEWFSAFHDTLEAMFAKLVRPLTKRPNAGALGRLHSDDRAILTDLLSRVRYPSDDPGLNVLLYGPRSIDKTGLVVDFIQHMQLPALTLAADIPDRDMGSVAYVVQRYVATTEPNAVLVLTAADKVLTRTRRGVKTFAFFRVEMDDEVEDAEADAALLALNPAKTLWLVNAPDRLSEDNLGRFLFISEVRAASRAERLNEIRAALDELDVSPELHKELSQHLRLSEQQLKSARRLVKELSSAGPQVWTPEGVAHNSLEHREALIRRLIDQSQRAMDRREREHLRQPVTTYSLDLLNLNSTFTVEKIVRSLKQRQHGSLCFYGLPGTGKTQLAEHIAVQLDKPIIMKRASELTNKFVGESEKNIRQMFDEAAEEDAVLFLDEADTFLMDRSRAMHSWETSSVNEMLQGMERFKGVFICATNLFDSLDRAALRRFTFKLQFLSLTEEQRWRMLCTEAKLDPSAMTAEDIARVQQELLLMYELTPGDYATVQRQVELLGEPLSMQDWLRELSKEAEFKKKAEQHQREALLRMRHA